VRWTTAGLLLALLFLVHTRGDRARTGTELCAAGQLFATGTDVVLWTDPGGYDAYLTKKRFVTDAPDDGKRRYAPLRRDLPAAVSAAAGQRGVTLAELQQVVHLLVLHYDAAGTSRQCFRILQDERDLSVHFLLDVDGTVYQTLDLQETAWHATIANASSIGVEIAHPGAFRHNADALRQYERDADGWRLKLLDPAAAGVRTPAFVPRPLRPEPVHGLVHGVDYWQFDYTPQQYEALAHLCAALNLVFPRIRLEVPRGADGEVLATKLAESELLAFDGIVGHFHVQLDKQDPGPALQWQLLLERARGRRAELGR
jgi:N-acetyl-anhydromuramyl-L-alanine amidase AmpD